MESSSTLAQHVDVNMINFWNHFKSSVFQQVMDTAGFQGNINNLTFDEMVDISKHATETFKTSFEAHTMEVTNNDHKSAIGKWREVFEYQFPTYG